MSANNYSVNFTSRCQQIQEAQWVCHNVTANFPHLSSTRLAPFISNLEDRFSKIYDDFVSIRPYSRMHSESPDEQYKKVIKIFYRVRNLIRNINQYRDERFCFDDFLDIRGIMNQLRLYKLGNCYENAKISEAIMRVNGHENVYTGALKVGDRQIDHVVCFFNKDGSPFDGKVNKNTIIIDSWLNETDFADNMLLKYRNRYKDFLFIPKDGKLSFRNVETLNLSKEELAQLASEFPQLLK